MGTKVPICTFFSPNLASRHQLIVLEAQVLNFMGFHSSSIRLNNIKLFALLVAPPALKFIAFTTCPLHHFGQGPGVFPPTYKILPFAIFQKLYFCPGNISASVKNQSNCQHFPLPYPYLLCQGVSGHHIMDWCLHTLLLPQILVTLKPTALTTRCQNGIFPCNITYVPFCDLISITFSPFLNLFPH